MRTRSDEPTRRPRGRGRVPAAASATAVVFAVTAATLAAAAPSLLTGCRSTPSSTTVASVDKGVKADAPLFRDISSAGGLHFSTAHTDPKHLTILDTSGHGCAFVDVDNDDRLDIVLVGKEKVALYRNRGGGRFEDISAASLPPVPRPAYLLGVAAADFDRDGHTDLFLTGYGRTLLWRNQGEGRFADVTHGSGLEARDPADWTTSVAWADVDGDDLPDLYVCRYVQFDASGPALCEYTGLDGKPLQMSCGPLSYAPQRGSLYRNLGGGRFRDLTQAEGAAGAADAHGNALGCLFSDFDADGRPELYVANDRRLCDLFTRTGAGAIKNVGSEAGVAVNAEGLEMSGMGVDAGDFNNDGRMDLLVATYQNEPKCLFRNEGNLLFTQEAYTSGLGAATLPYLAFGAVFIDADNDGWLDVAFTNGHVLSEIEKRDPNTSYRQPSVLLLNQGNGRFKEAGVAAGEDFTRPIVGRSIARGDFDVDGVNDLLLTDLEGAPLLLRGEGRSGRRGITLRCRMTGSDANPRGTDAIGARITVTAAGRTQTREIKSGGSYLSADAPEAHFGLGSAPQADRIVVRWPGKNGGKTEFRDVPAGRAYVLTSNGSILPVPRDRAL